MDALREVELSDDVAYRHEIKRGMSRAFPGYEGGLRPEFRFVNGSKIIPQGIMLFGITCGEGVVG